MRLKYLLWLIKTDLYRHGGRVGPGTFLSKMMFSPEFKCTFWFRLTTYLGLHGFFRHWLYHAARLVHLHYRYQHGVVIPAGTPIGTGLLILHSGGIVVHEWSVVGKNCTISQGVTLGFAYRGQRAGSPIIGDNVFIGPGAKIIGRVRIGDNALIGANAVVSRDVPENAVVVGIPGRVISYDGSRGHITNVLGERAREKAEPQLDPRPASAIPAVGAQVTATDNVSLTSP